MTKGKSYKNFHKEICSFAGENFEQNRLNQLENGEPNEMLLPVIGYAVDKGYNDKPIVCKDQDENFDSKALENIIRRTGISNRQIAEDINSFAGRQRVSMFDVQEWKCGKSEPNPMQMTGLFYAAGKYGGEGTNFYR